MTSALDGRAYGYDAFAIGETVLFHLSQERFDALICERNENHSAFGRMMRLGLPLAAVMYGLIALFMLTYWPLVGVGK